MVPSKGDGAFHSRIRANGTSVRAFRYTASGLAHSHKTHSICCLATSRSYCRQSILCTSTKASNNNEMRGRCVSVKLEEQMRATWQDSCAPPWFNQHHAQLLIAICGEMKCFDIVRHYVNAHSELFLQLLASNKRQYGSCLSFSPRLYPSFQTQDCRNLIHNINKNISSYNECRVCQWYSDYFEWQMNSNICLFV